MFMAAKIGDVTEIIKILESGANVMCRDSSGNTLLHIAALSGHPGVCNALVARGIDVNATNSAGETSLLFAAQGRRAHAAIGATTRGVAAEAGAVDVVQALLGAGANANAARTTDGQTPLLVAAEIGKFDVVQALAGASGHVDGDVIKKLASHMLEQQRRSIAQNQDMRRTIGDMRRALDEMEARLAPETREHAHSRGEGTGRHVATITFDARRKKVRAVGKSEGNAIERRRFQRSLRPRHPVRPADAAESRHNCDYDDH